MTARLRKRCTHAFVQGDEGAAAGLLSAPSRARRIAHRHLVEGEPRAAPDLFVEELEQTVQSIASAPLIGALTDPEGPFGMRRVLMPRTQFFVYYRVHGEELLVLAIWHASRGRQPRVR